MTATGLLFGAAVAAAGWLVLAWLLERELRWWREDHARLGAELRRERVLHRRAWRWSTHRRS